ncbi:putative disease resistance RPP8-like protein 2 [Sesamum alatum]|uniref:Disease resistance RPP8-like protein 2 n=1 Tax=Sesamum alatum TaxID=300844 RepID=A0AAE1YWN0_9LAMI|nr:putative disease resistance RPP8-like protein 2 [Sesamum alatum]
MREEYMVGFEDEMETLIGYLTKENEELDVISIYGMGGIGKTTLARAIFRHPRIEYNFPVRLWIYVSSGYRVKDIFLSMLRDLRWITVDMYDKTDLEIAQTLCARLEKEKFLIVLDDVWTTKAWDNLKVAFPKTNKMSKILITSRSSDVATYANPNRCHKLRLLHINDSWILLQFSVFGYQCFPQELEDIAEYIVRQCKGLPFMIKLVGAVLRKTTSVGEMKVIKSLWTKVAEKIKTFHYKAMDTISLSYHALPWNLKPCFLYLGTFPEDFEIPVERLILLWIAEGFIQQKTRISLEETAKECLEDLIDRNLVMIDKVSANDAFKLLRVLDVRAIIFTRFPFYLTQLVHLRYIALSSDFKVLPEAISKLWNIQTIIVFTSSRILEIKADILKMIYLRHLETNASIILRKQGESGNGGNIQVLANLSPESCTGYLFEKANNLKKLGIRGRLTILLDDKSGSSPFDNLGKLHQLENLKLLNDVHIYPDEAKLPCLPPPHKFPPKLISLTLSYTLLKWEQMYVLGMLEHLRVLKLKNTAFVGERWEAVDGGFRQLEVLHIQYTNLVVWEASSHHFPKLQHLKLWNCEKLEALPFGLAEISGLQVIDLYRTTKSAAASARKIQNEIESLGRRLKLSIFPIDE